MRLSGIFNIQQNWTMQPQSTVDRSNSWKIWHGLNYFMGGGTFLFGSILLFPAFNDYLDAAEISGWLYTIGSATFLLADITEWLHYLHSDCRFLGYILNFLVSVSGSLLYLIGSACFIPALGYFEWGMDLFISGSALIVIAQTWKLVKAFSQKGKTWREIYGEDASGVMVDFFAGAGGLMYFCGTFIFKLTADRPELTAYAALVYSLGGLFFFSSGAFMQKRYFWEGSGGKGYSEEIGSGVSTEI